GTEASVDGEIGWRQRLRFALLQAAGAEYAPSFESLVALLLCKHGESVLRYLNPFAASADANARAGKGPPRAMAAEALAAVAAVMFAASRRAQALRCVLAAQGLLVELRRLAGGGGGSGGSGGGSKGGRGRGSVSGTSGGGDAAAASADVARTALSLKSEAVAAAAAKQRYYTFPEDGGGRGYDPRLLLMEFNSGFLLHESQVALLRRFMQQVSRGGSLCHQMIMGAGKTTTVAPTLSLLLADGSRLVMEVVPDALLDFAYNVMRSVFSQALHK
ncbi:unnamed protein product, partial [Phaeothamnion confervicola]